MNERGKSDSPVVPAKPSNNAASAGAEVVEERELAAFPSASPLSSTTSATADAAFFDRAGSASGSRITPPTMLPSGQVNGVGTPNSLISRLNSPACTCPYQRFIVALADDDA